MRLAADFRSIARDVLDRKWKIAVLVGLVATILGAVEDMGPEVKINIDMSSANASFEFAGQTIFSTGGGLNSDIGAFLVGGFTYIMIAALIMGAVYFILGSIIKVGYAKFNLNLADRIEGSLKNLFAYFSFWKTTAAARFLQSIYVLLWSLLFIIPGIIKSYEYAMVPYLLADNSDMDKDEILNLSRRMMEGNKWDFFVLELSFIGWILLAVSTFNIVGILYVDPYIEATHAQFYLKIKSLNNKVMNENVI